MMHYRHAWCMTCVHCCPAPGCTGGWNAWQITASITAPPLPGLFFYHGFKRGLIYLPMRGDIIGRVDKLIFKPSYCAAADI